MRKVLLFACLIWLLGVSPAPAAYDTINTVPSGNTTFLTDLQTFLRQELPDYMLRQAGSSVLSGGYGATSANLTHTLSAVTAFVDGHYTYNDAVSHTYTATRRTFVYLRADSAASVTIAGAAITYDGNFVFAEMAAGTGQPATPAGIAPLLLVDTSGAAITAVTDYRSCTAPVEYYGDLATAVTTIGSSMKARLVATEKTALTGNVTLSSNITLVMRPGAGITTTGYTLTINGPFEGSPGCFVGTGTVTFGSANTTVRTSWWGADATGTTDSAVAIQAAINSSAKYVDGEDGLYYVTTKLSLVSNQTVMNMRLFDTNYRTSSQHNFLEAVGTIGAQKVNINIENVQILGNNSTYAVSTDSWTYNAYGVIDGVGIFMRYVTGTKISNVTCTYMESCTALQLVTNADVDGLISTQAEAETHTGFSFLASYDSVARNVRIFNGGDGALFIYNGSNCHIVDSLVKNTTPATYNLAGSGIESAVNCSLRNVKAEGSWIGFALVESALNVSLVDSTADGCHVGIFLGPFGYGAQGGDISIRNNRVIHMADDGATTYPVSGILVYNSNNAHNTPHNVRIEGNLIGFSDAGVGIYIDVPNGKEATNYKISNNTVLASTSTSFNWETQVSKAWNTQAIAMYLKNLWYSEVMGNMVQDAANPAVLAASVSIVRGKAIKFHENNLQMGVATVMVLADATSDEISVVGNKIQYYPGGGLIAFNILGTSTIIHSNTNSGDTRVIPNGSTYNVADYAAYGIKRFVTALNQTLNLPACAPHATGSLGFVEPVEFIFTSQANTLTLHPPGTDTIRGGALGADTTVTAGNTKTLTCYTANFWEVR